MSDKTSSSVGVKSFETISEEDGAGVWENLLGDQKIPTIIKTEASTDSIGDGVSSHPRTEDLEARLTRSRSLNQRRNSSSNGLLGFSFHKQLKQSLRGVHSEPASVKDVPITRKDSSLFLFRYRQARYASRRVRKRVIFKHGDCNVVQWNIDKRRRRYMQDIFTTLVDAQWRWTLLVFALNFLLSWLFFAVVWWLIIFTHGDLHPETWPKNATFTPCLTNVNTFTACFLFSVETQHTIGYGGRTTNEECPEAIFIMCLQSIVGVFIQAFMVGLIFAKLARAKKRNTTLLFSRNVVICLRDGEFSLIFRVGDLRKSHILEAHVRAQIIWKKVTREGEVLPFYQQELKVGADGEEDRLMFIWPMTIVHKINERSPLYNMSATDMLRERFEIVVMLEGVIESTGMTTQARSSFLPSEICWGHRFEPMITFRKDTAEYEVDYTKFHNTYEVDTPLCSAKQLDELRATVSTSQKLDRMLGTIPKSFSDDTLDMSSVDSMSLDEHIEIKIPEARARETRLMAQNNFVQHISERHRNGSHQHLSIDMAELRSGHDAQQRGHAERGEGISRSHSHASIKRMPNGHAGAHDDHHAGAKSDVIRKSPSDNHIQLKLKPAPLNIPILVTSADQDPA